MNIFQKISLLSKLNNAWKRSKKLIDENKATTEEVRQIAFELIALLDRLKVVLPPLKAVIEQLIGIIKDVLS